jgi:RNA polymerase sigma factor for flagellar operon FliA
MDPKSTYLEQLTTIERIAAFVARRAHLSPDDTEEFVQVVRVRLFLNDYAIIRKFEGRSTFSTYLTTVIRHLFHEWRVERWGKWRPSAEARRLGDRAITFERLLTRDNFSLAEAVRIMTTRAGAEVTVAELEAIWIRLPVRNPPPVEVSGNVSPDVASVEPDAEERLAARDRVRTLRRTAKVMDEVLATFGAEDRLILQLRFWEARKVPEIARIVATDQKKLYKRFDKLLAALRRALEAAGVSRADVDELVGKGDHEIRLNVLDDGESDSFRPSNKKDDDDSGGGGKLP